MEKLLYPLATEKAIRIIESDNIITFIVGDKTKKTAIKKEFEETFKVKVENVNIVRNTKGKKKAYIRIGK